MKTTTYVVTVMVTLSLILLVPNKGFCMVTMLSTEELVARADLIVIGEVVSTDCEWDDANLLIYTLATLEVEKDIKNTSPSSHLTIRYVGGTVDNITLIIPGYCTLSRTENVLLYLEEEDGNTFRILGNVLGKHQIVSESETGVKFIKSGFVSSAKTYGEENVQKTIRLDDYLAEVRTILQKLGDGEQTIEESE